MSDLVENPDDLFFASRLIFDNHIRLSDTNQVINSEEMNSIFTADRIKNIQKIMSDFNCATAGIMTNDFSNDKLNLQALKPA